MFASLRSRLALSNLAITLVALLILAFVFAQLLRQRNVDLARSFIGQQANLVQRDVNSEIRLAVAGNSVRLGEFYRFFFHDSRILAKRVILFSRAHSCAFDSAGFYGPRRRAQNPPRSGCVGGESAWLAIPSSSRRRASRFIRIGNTTYLVSQRPTSSGTTLIVVTNGSAVIPSLGAIAPAFLLSALAAGVVWLVMGIYFAYSVSRPLDKMTRAAHLMAAGDYTQRVDVKGGGEIGELATSFNDMVTQVRTSNQLLKDFVANVSHDLRTPLTLISGYAGTILDGTARTQEESLEAAQVIVDEAVRMQSLVDGLLQLTRLEAGLRKFDQKPVSIPELVSETIRRTTAAMGGRTIANRVPDSLPPALGDEELMDRVLMNLLSNALEYTPPDGTVEVTATARGEWIEIRVSDTGKGLAPEDRARVFERLYRVDPSRSREDGHSGLGLPIVKEIVEAHGGSVKVESEPGRGSTFCFTVPSARSPT